MSLRKSWPSLNMYKYTHTHTLAPLKDLISASGTLRDLGSSGLAEIRLWSHQ
ncbi:hypothetical protein PENANT_c048G11535 [Penicillium antarcticum]|uniref:Uncharacterized protein n=1 Tax=Penicillium antarcticum TaxID=416450 RepID=A0A1V6PSS0_9EURO|nr:hypothetical protein PENANT_c048G11535 [Penicillium antarcticum]